MHIRTIQKDSYEKTVLRALLEIPNPPERLWLKGSLPEPGTKMLAVVGSRALTPYGRDACTRLIRGLAGYPISIVSGLALGADACAHTAALAAGLHTIAIPGSGLHDAVIAPQTNLGIAKDIIKSGGALLSEHPPEVHAHAAYFPSRNRIMVGIADAVLIIEAGEKSGTLITARLAGEYSRDLLCIPHRIGDAHGYGAHLFLRLGAALITESRHILEALGIPFVEEVPGKRAPVLTGNEKIAYDLLEEPHTRDAFIRASGLPHADALTALVTLELKGLVHEAFGSWRRS